MQQGRGEDGVEANVAKARAAAAVEQSNALAYAEECDLGINWGADATPRHGTGMASTSDVEHLPHLICAVITATTPDDVGQRERARMERAIAELVARWLL